MSNNGLYMIKIYKDKFLEKSYSTTQEDFGKYHTALMELAKEYDDLSFSFGFDGVPTFWRWIEMLLIRCFDTLRIVVKKNYNNQPPPQTQLNTLPTTHHTQAVLNV